MINIKEAVLSDGSTLPYVVNDAPPSGTMKYVYFAPDKSYVVQFFNEPGKIDLYSVRKRLESIIGKYNPTLSDSKGGAKGNTETAAKYFAQKFCWPRAIVEKPEFGIVCPAYPKNFSFDEHSSASPKLPLQGKDKKSRWFTSQNNRKDLSKSELGDFRSMLQIAITLARAIRRMHQAGLSHSDLSCNNVLIDPKTGTCIVIDIDSLVVPGLYPPEVLGTPGYQAPETVASDNPPCIATDLHAMAVLIYEYFFFRHPLEGPKTYSAVSAEEANRLEFGSEALFIENPKDTSNRPPDKDLMLKGSTRIITIEDFGPGLKKLFLRAFVDGLHNPSMRPTAMEWERELTRIWDMLQPCTNPSCEAKWFILHDASKPICPFCGHHVRIGQDFLRLKLMSNVRGNPTQWSSSYELNVYDGLPLFSWHIFSGIFPNENVDRTMLAYIRKQNDKWYLVNNKVQGMKSPMGNLVPVGAGVELKDGVRFLASETNGGFLFEVKSV